MPPNHSVRGGTLTIPNFRSVYSGEYICSASSPVKNYETSVFIIVTGKYCGIQSCFRGKKISIETFFHGFFFTNFTFL